MKKLITVLSITVLLTSCMDNKVVLPRSVGAYNKVTVVAKGSLWTGSIGVLLLLVVMIPADQSSGSSLCLSIIIRVLFLY